MIEMFRPIKGYEGLYEVSNLGRVKSCNRFVMCKDGKPKNLKEKIIVQKDDGNGYLIVNLYKNSRVKHFKVHRLVAEAFILNPSNLRDVNHIDENKYNNCVNNLEWLSHQDNLNYGTRNERASVSKSIKVGQYNKNTQQLIATYKNAYIAEAITKIDESCIQLVCKGKRKTAGGYIWKYMQ